jgi:hypothetical protein
MATERIFTEEQQEVLAEMAQRRGFAEVREYLLMLVEADAQQHGETLPITEDVDDDPIESFREGWEEVMRGEKMLTEEEFWAAVNSDEEDG